MKTPAAVLVVFSLLSVATFGASEQLKSREARELEMAKASISATLLADHHPKGKYRCSEDQYACLGASPAELGLALIGSRSTQASTRALAELTGYRLDAGLGEDFTCNALMHGKAFAAALSSMKPASLERQCKSEVAAVLKRVGAPFAGLGVDAVCDDERHIAGRKAELLEAIQQGKKCNANEY